MKSALFLLLLCLAPTTFGDSEDYYELLGINKDADNRDIRKAFKKLAVSMHPDKNQDDKDAHDKFVKIARAYETLKDPDLRKHYDIYGAEDNHNKHQGYQSWSYYRDNFGIYDDDPEIITLTRAEFEQSIENGEDTWFVNFYSAMCSHCHQMAPTWRKFAQRVQGVIRVGAVNCEEDWVLCRNQNIQSYPSLVYYPTKEKFHGDRSEDNLVEFVLDHLNVEVKEVTPSTWTKFNGQPRMLFFSDYSGDGPSDETRLKVAAMLDGLMMVAHVDCEKYDSFCGKLGASSGTAVWPTKTDTSPYFLPGLEAQEIQTQALAHLAEPPHITLKDFEDLQEKLIDGSSESWLLYFHLGEPESARLDLRKFPAKLPGMRIGRVNCGQSSQLCMNIHIHRYPVYGVFKKGGSYELYHGRLSSSDVAQFARQSSKAQHVTTLTPEEFGASAPLSDTPVLVDFFAPWCPPCMRLLPELRQASQVLGATVPVGTVDCTVHAGLCRKMDVNSYPTTRLYNGSKVDQFTGEHRASSIVEFLQDLMSPAVLELDDVSFYDTLGNKPEGELWLVDYFAPWCGPCQQLAPQWRMLAKMLSDLPMIKVASVNCDRYSSLCSEQGVRSYPSIRLYPMASRGLSQVALFSGYHRDAQTIRSWVMNFVPSLVEDLDENSFDVLVRGSSAAWVIDFYAPWCGHCTIFAPEFDLAARKLEAVNVFCGKVDCQAHRPFCQSLGVRAYPTVRLFLPEERGDGIDLSSRSADDLVTVVKSKQAGAKNHHDEL